MTINRGRYDTHLQWNITQPEKEQNNAICSNMDGHGDWNNMWNNKGTYLQNRNRVTDVENKLMFTGGKAVLSHSVVSDSSRSHGR